MPEDRTAAARVLVADDHDLARAGLISVLGGVQDIRVVADTSRGRDVASLVEEHHPDIVILDLRMPDMDGLEVTRVLRSRYPAVRVMIVSIHDHADYLAQAFRAGARGYVLKDATRSQIIDAVRKVRLGQLAVPENCPEMVDARLDDAIGSGPLAVHLTERELEILRLMAQGMSNPRIATQLHLGASTVKSHVEHIRRKLQAADRTQAVLRASELGFLSDGQGARPPLTLRAPARSRS